MLGVLHTKPSIGRFDLRSVNSSGWVVVRREGFVATLECYASAVKTFSLSTMMIAMVIAALLMIVTRLGYWPCIVASSLAGSLAVVTIPALFHSSPRLAFAIAGIFGGIAGCWLGTYIIPSVNDEPTRFLSSIEYRRVYWLHLRLVAIVVACSGLAGMIIGLGVHSLVGRDAPTP